MEYNLKDKKIINSDQVDKTKGFVFEFDDEDNPNRKLPDASKIMDQVIEILEFMLKDEIKTLRNHDKKEYIDVMEKEFSEFAESNYTLFMQIIEGKDLTPLYKMLSIIENINKGKTNLEEGEKDVGLYLSKFLPPHLLNKLN